MLRVAEAVVFSADVPPRSSSATRFRSSAVKLVEPFSAKKRARVEFVLSRSFVPLPVPVTSSSTSSRPARARRSPMVWEALKTLLPREKPLVCMRQQTPRLSTLSKQCGTLRRA